MSRQGKIGDELQSGQEAEWQGGNGEENKSTTSKSEEKSKMKKKLNS